MKPILIVIPVIIAIILGGIYLISTSSDPVIQPSELSPEEEQSDNTQELLKFQNMGLELRNNEDCVAFYSTGSTQYCVLEPSKYPSQYGSGIASMILCGTPATRKVSSFNRSLLS